MGDVIHKNASITTIVEDARTANTRAQARGGDFKQQADLHLKLALSVYDLINKKWSAAFEAVAPLQAVLDAIDDGADGMIGNISDQAWNTVGRPGSDPILSLLFPGGIAYYTNGPDAEQPARMELLADMLEANIHPRIDAKLTADWGSQLRSVAKDYRAAYEALAMPHAQAEMYGRMRASVARAVQIALVSFKRGLKALGHSEAEIHAIIPDRPRVKKPAATSGSPSPVPPAVA